MPDAVEMHVLWRETDCRLDSLAQAVRECKRVDEASNFGRWLIFSGVLKILEANPAEGPLPVDGKALRKKTEDLVAECGDLYRGGKHDPKYAASDIAEINRKLDAITAHVGLAVPISPLFTATAKAGDAQAPAVLCVLQGGAS